MAEQQHSFPDASGASTCQSLLVAESKPGVFKSEHQLPFMIIFDLWAAETRERIGFPCPAVNTSIPSLVCACVCARALLRVRLHTCALI